MQTDNFDFTEEFLATFRRSPDDYDADTRMAAAAKLFELGKISSGKGGELAGIPRLVFLHRLAEFNVSVIDLTPEELEQDVRNAISFAREQKRRILKA